MKAAKTGRQQRILKNLGFFDKRELFFSISTLCRPPHRGKEKRSMEDLKPIFANNLSALRKKKNWTQLELALRLNYSDKAVSKWERGESLPDVTILKQIADLFEVSVDYLLSADHTPTAVPLSKRKRRNRAMITGISAVTVWLIATIIYFSLDALNPGLFW